MIIAQVDDLDKVVSAASQANVPAENVLVFNHGDAPAPPGTRSWQELFDHGEEDWIRFNDEDTAKNTIAAYMMTSGTTGLAKAAAISHNNLVATQTLAYDMERKDFHVSTALDVLRGSVNRGRHPVYSTFLSMPPLLFIPTISALSN